MNWYHYHNPEVSMEKVSLLPKYFLSWAGAVTSAYHGSLETCSIFLTSSSFLSKAHSGYVLLQHQRLSVSSWATGFCYCLTSLIVGCRLAVVACLPFRTLSTLLICSIIKAAHHVLSRRPCSALFSILTCFSSLEVTLMIYWASSVMSLNPLYSLRILCP